MSLFKEYFNSGFRHIWDLYGYDHFLFIMALSAAYLFRDWRKVLILIVSYTFGYSLTLALSTYNFFEIRMDIITFFISFSIFVTAFTNIFRRQYSLQPNRFQINYIFALFFGTVHGGAFSYYFDSILKPAGSVTEQLVAYNIGLAIGQVIVIAVFMLVSFIFITIFNVSRRDWNLVISSAIAGIAITLMIQTKFW